MHCLHAQRSLVGPAEAQQGTKHPSSAHDVAGLRWLPAELRVAE